MTRKELIESIRAAAEPVYGEREAAAIARLVAEKRYGLSRADCALSPLAEIDPRDGFEALLADLAAARPVQYILGVADFDDLELAVGEGVLIPRPETEELVLWIADDAIRKDLPPPPRSARVLLLPEGGELPEREGNSPPMEGWPRSGRGGWHILDIGTGSGAIAIALAKRLPEANVTAIDISPEALHYARLNNEKHSAGITLHQADILAPDKLSIINYQLSIIVSNPPYIPASERTSMADNVTRYEPAGALFVPDDDPLVFYRAIAKFARRALTPEGALYFEIHEQAAQEVVELLAAEGFRDIEVRRDINSKPRMVKCRP